MGVDTFRTSLKLCYGPKAHLELKQKSFPKGVKSWYYPRKTNPLLSALQLFISFFIWHYFLWGSMASLILFILYFVGAMSKVTVYIVVIAYFAQLFFYYPQYGRGWSPYWKYILNSTISDFGLGYFDAWLVQEEPLNPKKRYMFGWAPHGLLGVCRVGSGGTWWLEAFPDIFGRWGSFGMAFYIPGVREFSLMVGACDASKETLAGRIQDGESIHLIPGGIKEMMLTDQSSTDTQLVLRNRNGFIRLAWEYGLDVVPVFCFGEKWTSTRVLLPAFLRRIMARFRMAGTMLTGRWGTLMPLIDHPKRGELSIGWVFGEAMSVKKQQLKEISAEEEGDIRRVFDSVDTNKSFIHHGAYSHTTLHLPS